MKKLMILALGALGLLGLSACGTTSAFNEKNNETVVLKGEEGLRRLNEAVQNGPAFEFTLFDKMTFDTDIDYIDIYCNYSGVLGIGETITSTTSLYGNSTTSFEGLLGAQEDFKYAKETLLSGYLDTYVKIPLLPKQQDRTTIDQFAILTYYSDGTLFFDVTPVITGALAELAQPLVDTFFNTVGELIAVPVIPGYNGITASLTNEKAQLIVNDIPTTSDPIITDEEKELIQEFFKTYPQVARQFLGETLSQIFTVTLEDDYARLDINLRGDLLTLLFDFLEEYIGVSVDIREYIPENLVSNLSIIFDENMLPTSFESKVSYSYDIDVSEYNLSGTYSSHSTTKVSYGDCKFVNDCGAKITVITPVEPGEDDDEDDVIIL